jgi:predicted enzyme related to lactoylglutathione lyase
MPGHIGWIDLTVADASTLRDFYQTVTGWEPAPVEMGGYQDFCMHPPGEAQPVAGICNARGPNADLPPVWMVYITVANLDESVARCLRLGGKLQRAVESMGNMGRFCVIADPAGAFCALFEPSKDA